jgi:hypothetical protein
MVESEQQDPFGESSRPHSLFPFVGCSSRLGTEHKNFTLLPPTGEVYQEKWPATPFSVLVKNKSYPGPVEVQCFVDGRLAAAKAGRAHDKVDKVVYCEISISHPQLGLTNYLEMYA